MARIRYIGEHLIARAFERTFHRNHWNEEHGLRDNEIAVLAHNPQFAVDGVEPTADPVNVAEPVGKMRETAAASLK